MKNWKCNMNHVRLAADILAVVCLLSFPAKAVNVPQTSAADYIFTRPLLTNHIHGVLGDTTNHYGVIRSEDVDWLREAFEERAYIAGGGLPRSPQAGVGSLVKQENALWNIALSDGWLDPDAPLLSGARAFRADKVFTNIYWKTTYTNGVTNAFSVIEMPMTNGTTSVFTNSWLINRLFPKRTIVTNIHISTYIDDCHGVDGAPFPAYSNATLLTEMNNSDTFTRFPSVMGISACREVLRGTTRLADAELVWTNSVLSIMEEESWSYGEDGGAVSYPGITNYTTGAFFEISVGPNYATRSYSQPVLACAPTRFTSSLVKTGGVTRVSIEAAYLQGYFSYSINQGLMHGVGGYVTVRLGTGIMDLTGNKACCRLNIDPYAICSECATCFGVPQPPFSPRARSEKYESWNFNGDILTIFYRITPATRLPDW